MVIHLYWKKNTNCTQKEAKDLKISQGNLIKFQANSQTRDRQKAFLKQLSANFERKHTKNISIVYIVYSIIVDFIK